MFKRGFWLPPAPPVWEQQAYLKASESISFETFGSSVAASGDTAVVGAPSPTDLAGQAYVFARSGTVWDQQSRLEAPNADLHDGFGRSVALSGNTIVVGAYLEDGGATDVDGDGADNSAAGAGAA